MSVRVQTASFDPGAELNALHAAQLGIGAVVGFVGYVRDYNDGQDVAGMYLEHYPGMTEKALAKIVTEAEARWPLLQVEVLHRVGALTPGEPIVFVGTASAHRQAAFAACDFIMDYLKTARRSGSARTPPKASAGSRAATATSRPQRAGISRGRCRA